MCPVLHIGSCFLVKTRHSSSLKKTRLQQYFACVATRFQEKADAIRACFRGVHPGVLSSWLRSLFHPLVLRSCKKSLSKGPTYSQHLWGEVVFKMFLAKSAMLQYPNEIQIWRGKPNEGKRCLFIPQNRGSSCCEMACDATAPGRKAQGCPRVRLRGRKSGLFPKQQPGHSTALLNRRQGQKSLLGNSSPSSSLCYVHEASCPLRCSSLRMSCKGRK